jgi:hypothetical protein
LDYLCVATDEANQNDDDDDDDDDDDKHVKTTIGSTAAGSKGNQNKAWVDHPIFIHCSHFAQQVAVLLLLFGILVGPPTLSLWDQGRKLSGGALAFVGRSWCAYHIVPAFHVHVPEREKVDGRTKS